MSTKRKPTYCLHKPTGQARVRIHGRDVYLGKHGSPESKDRYDDVVAEWLRKSGDITRYSLTIDDLALLYLEHAEAYYRKDGDPTSEVSCIKTALRYLVEQCGTARVRDFGPRALKRVRQEMVNDKHCRTSVNKHVGRIRRAFRWGVENEYLPAEIHSALLSVPGLRHGRSEAKELPPLTPVPAEHIQAIKSHVTAPVWGLVQLQLLTGARPGELIIMRSCDLSMTGNVWEYVPAKHKTQHHGTPRLILLGPKARNIVRSFLKSNPEAYLFSPQDIRSVKRGCRRQPGEHYDRDAYRNAIQRACDKAGVPRWHPHQLRHNVGTLIRKEASLDVARCVLGHATSSITQVYADPDLDAAKKIIRKVG